MDRQADGETDSWIGGQTDGQTARRAGSQTGGQQDRQTDEQTGLQEDRQADRQANSQTPRQVDRQTDEQLGRRADRRTDRQTDGQTGSPVRTGSASRQPGAPCTALFAGPGAGGQLASPDLLTPWVHLLPGRSPSHLTLRHSGAGAGLCTPRPAARTPGDPTPGQSLCSMSWSQEGLGWGPSQLGLADGIPGSGTGEGGGEGRCVLRRQWTLAPGGTVQPDEDSAGGGERLRHGDRAGAGRGHLHLPVT